MEGKSDFFEFYNDVHQSIDDLKDKKICVMCHNAYHSYLLPLNNRYNTSIATCGSSTSYLKYFERKGNVNYDILFLFSNKNFDEYELSELQLITQNVSKSENKKVTFGYSFSIPVNQRIDEIINKMIFCSYYKGNLMSDNPFVISTKEERKNIIQYLCFLSKIHNQGIIEKHL